MQPRVAALLVLVCLSCVVYSQAQDDCLDNAVAFGLVNSALQNTITEPASNNDIVNLVSTLANIIKSTSSPYAIDLGVGFSDDSYFGVYTCNFPGSNCFISGVGKYYAQVALPSNANIRYVYALDSSNNINLSNPLAAIGTYFPTQRPWFNASGWSASYQFSSFPFLGRSYEQTQQGTNAHVFADRVSSEPCGRCLSLSPSVNAGDYLASSSFVGSISNLETVAQVQSAISSLVTQFLIASQQGHSISSIGAGFKNDDSYVVTDCSSYPVASTAPECSVSPYFAAVTNPDVYGNINIVYYSLSSSGQIIGSGRYSQNIYNVTGRPWYLLQSGWTDPYLYATPSGSITARSYASAFIGGVVVVDPNPTQVCPAFSTCPSSSPTASPSPSPPSCYPPSPSPSCNGRSDTTINFNFADMLAN